VEKYVDEKGMKREVDKNLNSNFSLRRWGIMRN
jgi:hypothetical protein